MDALTLVGNDETSWFKQFGVPSDRQRKSAGFEEDPFSDVAN